MVLCSGLASIFNYEYRVARDDLKTYVVGTRSCRPRCAHHDVVIVFAHFISDSAATLWAHRAIVYIQIVFVCIIESSQTKSRYEYE